jgi:hypothetical protein
MVAVSLSKESAAAMVTVARKATTVNVRRRRRYFIRVDLAI